MKSSSTPHPSIKSNDKIEKIQSNFSKAVLTDYAQILGNSAAYGVSPHRIKLAKLQEISKLEPNYEPTSSLWVKLIHIYK